MSSLGYLRAPVPGDTLRGRHGMWRLERLVSASAMTDRPTLWRANGAGRVALLAIGDQVAKAELLRRDLARLQSLSGQDSEFVVELLDHADDPSQHMPWYAIPYTDHGALEDYFGPRPVRPLGELLAFAVQVLRGLMSAGVVHRDLTPSNLLVYRSERGVSVRIAGWGRSLGPGATQAPERREPIALPFLARGVTAERQLADVRDDLQSLGAILYWGSTGWPPGAEDGANHARVARLRGMVPALGEVLADIPPVVSTLVERLLDPDRDGRTPAQDSRLQYLQWTVQRLQDGIAWLDDHEGGVGARVLVGPGVVGRQAPRPRPALLAAPSEYEAQRTSSALELARSSADEPAQKRRPTPRASSPPPTPPLPPLPVESSAAALRAEPRSRRPEVLDRAPTPVSASPIRRYLQVSTLGALASVLVLHVAGLLLVFDPSQTVWAAVGGVFAVAIAGCLLALDLVLMIPSRNRAARRRLFALRVAIAAVLAVLVGQALMIRLVGQELAEVQRAKQSQAITTELVQLAQRRARARLRFAAERARLDAAVVATEATGQGDAAHRRTETGKGKAPKKGESRTRRSAATVRSAASLAAEKAAALEARANADRDHYRQATDARFKQLVGLQARTAAVRQDRVALLYRYLGAHPAALAGYAGLLLLLLLIEYLPFAVARPASWLFPAR